VAYERKLPHSISASFAFGIASLVNQDFQTGDEFNYAYNVLIDAFWSPISGARLGLEYAFGRRIDKNHMKGLANRISLLLYYDF
jgi:hypothetical protein